MEPFEGRITKPCQVAGKPPKGTQLIYTKSMRPAEDPPRTAGQGTAKKQTEEEEERARIRAGRFAVFRKEQNPQKVELPMQHKGKENRPNEQMEGKMKWWAKPRFGKENEPNRKTEKPTGKVQRPALMAVSKKRCCPEVNKESKELRAIWEAQVRDWEKRLERNYQEWVECLPDPLETTVKDTAGCSRDVKPQSHRQRQPWKAPEPPKTWPRPMTAQTGQKGGADSSRPEMPKKGGNRPSKGSGKGMAHYQGVKKKKKNKGIKRRRYQEERQGTNKGTQPGKKQLEKGEKLLTNQEASPKITGKGKDGKTNPKEKGEQESKTEEKDGNQRKEQQEEKEKEVEDEKHMKPEEDEGKEDAKSSISEYSGEPMVREFAPPPEPETKEEQFHFGLLMGEDVKWGTKAEQEEELEDPATELAFEVDLEAAQDEQERSKARKRHLENQE